MLPDMLLPIAAGAASAGAAWGAVKVTLNGTRNRVKNLEFMFEQHRKDERETDQVQADRLARVETKIDLLLMDKKLT